MALARLVVLLLLAATVLVGLAFFALLLADHLLRAL